MGAVKRARKRMREDWFSYDGECFIHSFVEAGKAKKYITRTTKRYWDYPYARNRWSMIWPTK